MVNSDVEMKTCDIVDREVRLMVHRPLLDHTICRPIQLMAGLTSSFAVAVLLQQLRSLLCKTRTHTHVCRMTSCL